MPLFGKSSLFSILLKTGYFPYEIHIIKHITKYLITFIVSDLYIMQSTLCNSSTLSAFAEITVKIVIFAHVTFCSTAIFDIFACFQIHFFIHSTQSLTQKINTFAHF